MVARIARSLTPFSVSGAGGLQQATRLCVTQGGSASLIVVGGRPLDAVHRIAEDGIAFAEIVKERGQRRELATDSGWTQKTRLHVLAPSDDMRACDGAERRRILQTGESH